jgi:hypothetical protein
MVDALFLANAVLEIASGVVALLVSFTAFKYNRLVENGLLRFVSFGFMLLGVGLVAQGSLVTLLAFNVGRITQDIALVYVSSVIYLVLQVMAYFAFALGYARGAYGRVKQEGIVTTAFLLALPRTGHTSLLFLGTYVNGILQLIVLVLLAFVIFQGALIYSRTRGMFSLLVLTGFALIFGAHAITLAASLLVSGLLYLIGTVVQFAGFAAILGFLIRSGRQGAVSKDT